MLNLNLRIIIEKNVVLQNVYILLRRKYAFILDYKILLIKYLHNNKS